MTRITHTGNGGTRARLPVSALASFLYEDESVESEA